MPLDASPRRRPASRRQAWARLSDEQLLQLRVCDLRLDLARSPLARYIEQLYAELDRRGIRFRPHVWLSGEWFSPDGVPGIAVPFYLAHPRLRRLARKMAHAVEGSNAKWLMRILRHEAGHAIDSAYRLRRRAHWRALFGPASRPYRAHYRARPASRRHVQHLGDWYAQAHPTEDFAETFAVWLAPRSNWQRRYAAWPALAKLRFIDALADELVGSVPPVRLRTRIEPLHGDRRTLAQCFRGTLAQAPSRRGLLADRLLQRVFTTVASNAPRAAALLRAHKARLLAWMIANTGVDRYTAHQILRAAIERSEALELSLKGSRRAALAATRQLLRQLARRYLNSQGLRQNA